MTAGPAWRSCLLMIGAVSKAGSMPFHSWIPDAAVDAPLPFMAFLPASLEKLLGIYFLARITLDLFQLHAGDRGCSPMLMIARRGHDPARGDDGAGAEGLQAAALVSRDQPGRLHDPGHRHGGAGRHRRRPVPHDQPRDVQELPVPDRRLGGEAGRARPTSRSSAASARQMPVTFACFIVAAASISGVPPFNGFFSKELIYDGALERALDLLRGGAPGLVPDGRLVPQARPRGLPRQADDGEQEREGSAGGDARPDDRRSPALCVLFGVYNALPLQQPDSADPRRARLEGHDFAGLPHKHSWSSLDAGGAACCALLNHLSASKRTGSGHRRGRPHPLRAGPRTSLRHGARSGASIPTTSA